MTHLARNAHVIQLYLHQSVLDHRVGEADGRHVIEDRSDEHVLVTDGHLWRGGGGGEGRVKGGYDPYEQGDGSRKQGRWADEGTLGVELKGNYCCFC